MNILARKPSLLVVGSGLTGATIARLAHDAGFHVTVLERRAHVGGNVRDEVHPCGLRIGCYGPHYFRTSSERVWRFVRRFGHWYGYAAVVTAWSAGAYHAWPPQRSPEWDKMTWRLPRRSHGPTFESAWLDRVPCQIYNQLVKPYTEKQWGCSVEALAPDLAKRVAVRPPGDRRLKPHRWQALPLGGYTQIIERMLEGCDVRLNKTYAGDEGRMVVVSTAPIDAHYGFDCGKLRYRSQRRDHVWYPDATLLNPEVQVNLPDKSEPAIREIEWKHMVPSDKRTKGSLVTRELPYTPTDPDAYEYPFPSAQDRALYAKYAERAAQTPRLIFAGRLGEYRYLDMDQAIARAMTLWDKRIRPKLEEQTH